MQITIVVDTPSASRALAPLARENFPSANITFVHIHRFTGSDFGYPRGLKWGDYPTVSEPVSRVQHGERWAYAPYTVDHVGNLRMLNAGAEVFNEDDCIIAAIDPGPSAAVSFDVLMQQIFGYDRASRCPVLALRGYDRRSLSEAFEMQYNFGEGAYQALSYGRVKRYFDWNWNVNSLAILGETQRLAGVPSDAPPLSKWALQLLYGIRGKQGLKEYDIFEMMTNWKGTGRYSEGQSAEPPRRAKLGSASSVAPIIQNLLDAGLLARSDAEKNPDIAMTDTGNRLMGLLHPDCEDADLPYRLGGWCLQGGKSKPAIDRYIKTFFGKQKRFLDSLTQA